MRRACRFPLSLMSCAGLLAAAPSPALAQPDPRAGGPSAAEPGRVEPVVVTATRVEQRAFDLPVAIDSVGQEEIQQGQQQVNLSESLQRVPGLVIQNRQNYAQDLQISSRGFGARATFGVRGIRLYQDGIPQTMPDGQGQTGSFSLSSARRIEVLRGPFSTLYGNASGGVIQVFTEDGPATPMASFSAFAGSWDSWRAGIKAGGSSDPVNWLVDFDRFDTGGYRDHSAARRDLLNAKFRIDTPAGGRTTVVVNALDQPETQDPLGLTRAQWEADPRQVDPVALLFDTRKSTAQQQIGWVHEQPIGEAHTLRLSLYGGQRRIQQFLAFSGAVGATSSGGITDLDRRYAGAGVRWTWQGRLLDRGMTLSVGADYDALDEGRKGFVNDFGRQGALRRDEDNALSNADAFAQAQWELAPSWSALLGVRYSRVKFDSEDHYIVGLNPDDSGERTFSSTNPVAGIVWHASPDLNLYANAGRGFETPTFIELAYRRVGTGLNFDLDAATSRNYEVGAKWRPARDHALNLALYRIDTRDEIVVDLAAGGRTIYKNAGGTRREGAELEWDASWGSGLRSLLAWTLLRATFTDAFTSGTGVEVPAGNRVPGIPARNLFAEVSWRHAPTRLLVALDLKHTGKVYVDDRNSDAAPAYTVVNARAVYPWTIGRWSLEAFGRVDNLGDRKYVGSVIVGDANGRYFEPAAERSWTVGGSARYVF